MKILVIPDIHQNVEFANKALGSYGEIADRIIFLGDYFDSFKTPPEVASFKETCIWLKYMVRESPWKEKTVFLIGNHDISYIFNNRKPANTSVVIAQEYMCSGITKSKINTFRQQFFDYGLTDDFFHNNFKICHKEKSWIFSHAGILPNMIPYGMTVDHFVDVLVPDVWRNFRNICYNHIGILTDVGVARGGNATYGGILWADLWEDFYPSYDIGRQVIGHTTVIESEIMSKNTNYESVCVDCMQKQYIIIDDNKIEPKKI